MASKRLTNEDPRVIRTKQRLYAAFTEMLSETSFENLQVTDMCARANITRVTFYAHYSDKFDLARDYIDVIVEVGRKAFYDKAGSMEKHSASSDYMLLLDTFLDAYFSQMEFFAHTSANENTYLFSLLSRKIIDHAAHYISTHEYMNPGSVSPRQIASFLAGGLWSFVDAAREEQYAEKEIRERAHLILQGLLALTGEGSTPLQR